MRGEGLMCATRTGGVRIGPCGSPRAELANHQVRPTEAGLMGWYGSPIPFACGVLTFGPAIYIDTSDAWRMPPGSVLGAEELRVRDPSTRTVGATNLFGHLQTPTAGTNEPAPAELAGALGTEPRVCPTARGRFVPTADDHHRRQPGRPIPKATGVPRDVHPPIARPAGTAWPHHRTGPGSARRPANRRRSSASGPTSPGCQ